MTLIRSLTTSMVGVAVLFPVAAFAAPSLAKPSGPIPPATTQPKAAAPVVPPDVPNNHPARAAVEGMVKKQIMRPDADGKFKGAKPVTRYELAVILDRLVTYIEASHQPVKDSKFPVPTGAVTAPTSHWAHTAQERLIRDGFVPVSSPLLRKPGTDVVTSKELVMILSTVSTRLTDRSIPVTKEAAPVD